MTKRGLTIWVIAALPIMATAQIPALGADPTEAQKKSLRGKPAVDVMPGTRRGLGYPLRYGGVVRGTVAVFIGGQSLREGEDYTLDYEGGVVYLNKQVRDSDSLRVSYRHDPATSTKKGGNGLPLMTLNFGGNSTMTMLLGIGGAERMNDGRVVQSQNIGFQNNFKWGGSDLSGLFLVSDRSNALVSSDSASPDMNSVARGSEGTDTFIKQRINTSLGSGFSAGIDYQRVGSNFGAFGMLSSAGMDGNAVSQFEKEKGISRLGFNFSGGDPKSLALANSFKSISDGKGAIQFHNYGFKTGLFDAYFTKRTIDSQFTRFNDIAEEDRAQLQKERGIARTGFGAGLRLASNTTLKFDDNTITAGADGIFRRTVGLDTPWAKLGFSTQSISQGFGRANDLAEGEKAQWAKERGFNRKDLTFGLPTGKLPFTLDFASKNVDYGGQSFDAQNLTAKAGKTSLEYWSRNSSSGFNRLDDLSAQEKDTLAKQVVGVYEPGAGANDNDRAWMARETGLTRNFGRLTTEFGKSNKFGISRLNVGSAAGDLSNLGLNGNLGNWKFDYRHINIDSSFNRMFDLIERERNLYGNQIGFDRTEWSLTGNLNAKTTFSVDSLGVGYDKIAANRVRGTLKGVGFEISGGMRNVDGLFARTNDINDGEKDFLGQLKGYNQSDLSLKLDAIKNLSIQGLVWDANNGIQDKHRYKRYAELTYKPDGKTMFGFRMNQHRLTGLNDQLFLNDMMQMAATHDFGKFGIVSAYRERENQGGKENQNPGRTTDFLKWESRLSKDWTFTTEQARTQFDSGAYENVQSYKIGWQVNKKLGISLTDVQVDRDGTRPDQRATNFGINYDFGNNLRLAYRFAKDLNTVAGGKHDTNWDLTPGSFGGFDIGGSYYEGGRYGDPMSMIGKFSLVNPKSFDVGFLKEVKLQIGYDAHDQAGVWQRQQKVADISAKAFGTQIGVGVNRVLIPGGQYAEDRGVRMNLDPSGKKPLQLGLVYKVRRLPDGKSVTIRDFDFSYKMGDKLSISHTTDNYAEKSQQGTPLGTTLSPTFSRRWAVDYKASKSTNVTFGFEDLSNIDQHTLARKTDVAVKLFADSDSPLRLSYGVVQGEKPGEGRRTRHEWQVAFDQAPGPNQSLSFAIGSIDWQHGAPQGEPWTRLLLSVDYQLRF